MKRSMKQISAVTAAASAGLLAIAGLCGGAGVRVNSSKSIPPGFYLASDRPPIKGSYVLLCPPQNAAIAEARRRGYLAAGFCPGGYGYLMKMVLAVEGGTPSRSRRTASV